MNTANREAVDAAHAVTVTRGALDKLLEIERMLEAELPAAQAAHDAALKKLRAVTRTSKPAARKAELDLLRAKITAAKQTEVVANG